jgi:hypothetical protein
VLLNEFEVEVGEVLSERWSDKYGFMIKGMDDIPVYSASTVDEFVAFELSVEMSSISL